MRSYDFESVIERKGMDALAVDGLGKQPGFSPNGPKEGFDIIPMWIADMNFKTPECITNAIAKRLEHPLFGYFPPREEYFNSIIRWHEKRNGIKGLKPEHIGYENGVLGGLVSVLNALLEPGDKVMLHKPTYIGFTGSITNAGYEIVHSELVPDAEGIWRMDYDDMERIIKENKIKVCVFCNPHNPCGRVWTKEEIAAAEEVYRRNGCTVISDEIWSDILLGGKKYTPYQAVSESARDNCVALYAPSKTFNLAGLVGSYHIIYNASLREKVLAASSKSHYNSMNVLSMHALIGAYTGEGAEWVDQLTGILTQNVEYARAFFEQHGDDFDVTYPEGTYMLFIDGTGWCERTGRTVDDLLKAGWDVGVAWQDGRPFKEGNYIRMNLALPLSRVQEAFKRIGEHVI